MAYTNAWSDTIPLGSELASHIDDQIRQLRLDVHERMNVLVVDWTTDPVVPIAIANDDLVRYIDASLFEDDGSGNFFCSLSSVLPYNCTITNIQVWIQRISGTNTWTLFTRTFGAGSYTPDAALETLSTSAGAVQTLDTGAISHALDNAKMYNMEMTGGSFLLFGCKVTFTRP